MTGRFSSKNDVFSSNTCQFYKKQYFYTPVRVSLAILMQIKKKFVFSFQLQTCGSSSACRKKTPAGEWLQCCDFEIFINDKISLET